MSDESFRVLINTYRALSRQGISPAKSKLKEAELKLAYADWLEKRGQSTESEVMRWMAEHAEWPPEGLFQSFWTAYENMVSMWTAFDRWNQEVVA